MSSAADMQTLFGKAILFVFRTQSWSPTDFANCAKFARSLGYDTISPKRGEGTQPWYSSVSVLQQERQAVLDEGCKFAPFWYCDGPKYGLGFIPRECDFLKQVGDTNDGNVIADMETEWNGQVTAAQIFNEQMRPWPGILGVTTWADPQYQNWLGVASNIAPCVNLWIPQRYDNWLASVSLPSEETIIQPALDLSQEFGPNNVLGLAKSYANEHLSGWIWEYVYAKDNPVLAANVALEFQKQ
jgi:hypothetical protein